MSAPIEDAEVVGEPDALPPIEPGRELVRVDSQMGKIIVAETPAEILAKATEVANELAKLVTAQDLARDVGGRKKHVEVGAWQALGALLGAFGGQSLHAETVWTRRVADADGRPEVKMYHVQETRKKWGKVDGRRQIIEETASEYDAEGYDWEARVEIRTASGVVVGIAEAECSRAELSWMSKADPAVRSMAETRAESRAYRRAVGWLMAIAGYNPTPAEEMPSQEAPQDPFGDPAGGELIKQASNAIGYLCECADNDQPVKDVLGKVSRDAGYLPGIVLKAVVYAAVEAHKAKAERDAASGGEKGMSDAEVERAEALAAEHGAQA